MSRTRILLRKELLEVRRSRGLLLSMFALPIPMVVVALVLVNLVMHVPASDLGELVRFYRIDLGSGDLRLTMIHFWVRECAGLFLVMPLFIPVLISAQSVAGEKERRTIEPLLASPLTAAEIVLAKSLAAVLPALAITLISFVLFAVGVDIVAWPAAKRILVPDESWLFALLVLAPLLSFFGNTITVLVSSRVSDSRLAQQLAALDRHSAARDDGGAVHRLRVPGAGLLHSAGTCGGARGRRALRGRGAAVRPAADPEPVGVGLGVRASTALSPTPRSGLPTQVPRTRTWCPVRGCCRW